MFCPQALMLKYEELDAEKKIEVSGRWSAVSGSSSALLKSGPLLPF